MEEKIRIEIHSFGPLVTGLLVAFFLIFFVGLSILTQAFSAAGLIVWLVLWVPLAAVLIAGAVRPTVIRCDEANLCWRHLGREHTVPFHEIKAVQCEPYIQPGRYSAAQRIALTVVFRDEFRDQLKFNDAVDSSALAGEKLGGRSADIPLVRLYQYLHAHIPPHDAE